MVYNSKQATIQWAQNKKKKEKKKKSKKRQRFRIKKEEKKEHLGPVVRKFVYRYVESTL